MPDELCSLLRACPKEGYDAIFEAGSATIQKLLADPKWLGSPNVGFFGVLHTWGRDPMIFHPHVHFIVPCGGVSDDGKKWIGTPSNFLFPEAVASPIYRQKFREILRAAGREKNVDPSVWHKWWEVNVKPVSDGRAVLKYLAPYVFRVAISDNRILECTDESVTFKYTPSGTKTVKTRKVSGVKLVRGFLQHAC
ncbi:MAG: transposase [Planctomycetaceae bacterium]